MKTNLYARKERQLKFLVKKLKRLIAREQEASLEVIQAIKRKISSLLKEMAFRFSKVRVQTILGSLAVIFGLGLTTTVNAQSFYPKQVNPFNLTPAGGFAFPEFVDLDGDGDFDMLVGEYYGAITYYENTGSADSANFASPSTNPFGIAGGYYIALPALADIDGDGDLDLFTGSYGGDIYFQENTGDDTSPSFGNIQVNPFGLTSTYYVAAPTLVDIDNDGDYDLFVGEYYGTTVFFENTGTASNPLFAAPVSNPFGLTSVYEFAFPEAADLDGDGDYDLLIGEYYGDLLYFENTGDASNPSFAAPVTNPFGLESAYELPGIAIADLDNDGDMDVMVGEYYGDFNYYSNNTITSVAEVKDQVNFSVYPNPARNQIQITTDREMEAIEIIDLSGKLVGIEVGQSNTIDVSGLKPGFYILKAQLDNDEVITRRVEIL